MASLRVPGAIVLVDVPSVGTWIAGLGTDDLATGSPMNVDDHVRIGSITKTLTATVILQLVDEGKVQLDAPVARYLTGVPDGRHVTVREMLDMTSGLLNTTESDAFNRRLDANLTHAFTPAQLLPYAFDPALSVQKDPYFAPNQGFHYSNTNYILLGLIAQKVTHQDLPTLFQRRIFGPLGMTHSSLPVTTDRSLPRPFTHGYNYGTNVDANDAYLAALRGDLANAQIKAGPDEVPTDATHWTVSYTWPDGGAVSTAQDLARYARALATGELLRASTQTQRLALPGNGGYGLGIERLSIGGLVGHNGAIPGFQSFMGYGLKTGATIIVLANLQVAPNVYLGNALPADGLAEIIAADPEVAKGL
jgi:D-alanyl-D-alanine carboxypeptidase